MAHGSLNKMTLILLSRRPRSLTFAKLADELNASDNWLEPFTASWLAQYAIGRCQNPSVNKVQALYEHLTGNKLIEG